MTARRLLLWLIAGSISAGFITFAAVAPLIDRARVRLSVEVLDGPRGSVAGGATALDIVDEEVVRTLDLQWPPGQRSRLVLRLAPERPGPTPPRVALRIEATLHRDGRAVRSGRRIEFEDSTTAFLELYREQDAPLLLALEAETTWEHVAAPPPSQMVPVQFLLEIQRVQSGAVIPVETNLLKTFVGQAVAYEFRLGAPGAADGAAIELRPVRILDRIIEVELQLRGALPQGDTFAATQRSDRFYASRDAPSTMSVEAGEPPTGWRFVFTPRW